MKLVVLLNKNWSEDIAIIRSKAKQLDLELLLSATLDEAMSNIKEHEVFAFVLDISLVESQGEIFLRTLKAHYSSVPVIIIAESLNRKQAVSYLQCGARACLEHPASQKEIAFQLSKIFGERAESYNPFSLVSEERKIILPNDFGLVVQVVKDLVYTTLPTEENNKYQVILGLNEIVNNAIEHGNLAISFEEKSEALKESVFFELAWERANSKEYRDRVVEINASVFPTEKKVVYVVKDMGQGFNWRNLPNPKDDINLLKRNGRGLMIAMHAFDELSFNEKGNEVTLVYQTHKPKKKTARGR